MEEKQKYNLHGDKDVRNVNVCLQSLYGTCSLKIKILYVQHVYVVHKSMYMYMHVYLSPCTCTCMCT